jgi:hypothetical protein
MFGPEILVRSLSHPSRTDSHGNRWQYHSRSDHHSKVACWGIVFDLLLASQLLRHHVQEGRVGFGINHEMRDFVHDRKKNLDMVLCSPASGGRKPVGDFAGLIGEYGINLTSDEVNMLATLPILPKTSVGSILMALEAKAAMTAHQKALPRLYDELNSSHLTVHGATEQAIAAGFVMVNIAGRYVSPDRNKKILASDHDWSVHRQPRAAQLVVDKVKQLPKRAGVVGAGYDALAIVVVDAANDGSPIRLISSPPAPQAGDIYDYASMIDRTAHIYATRFKDL